MRYFIILPVLLIIISCNQPMRTDENTTKSKIIKSTKTGDSVEVLFGSKILANFHFPADWKLDPDTSASESDEVAHRNWIKVYQFFGEIDEIKTIPKPEIKNIEYLRIKYKSNYTDDPVDSLINPIDSIRIKLPNIGPYECYYSQQITRRYESPDDYFFDYESKAGNIILYDPKTSTAKVINTFFSEESLNGKIRYFYIALDKTIHIFNGDFTELDASLKHDYIVKIKANGKIEIIEDNTH